ncbi:uncharacterized protein RCO7_10056 [Rhynchosporium graminicola]|uniref:Uncharacterized protein n=1 Tax=Rhynchosporium graminicola TaxID=2792576 RepID=A0A1E1KBX5_9HELO|nr:uncharacterized protein RCO7_10056 [Rhynchosporium commune]
MATCRPVKADIGIGMEKDTKGLVMLSSVSGDPGRLVVSAIHSLLMATPESELRYAVLPRTYKNRAGHVKDYYSENPLVREPAEEETHQWWYLSEQKPEEVYAIKFYDSEALKSGDGSVRSMCPHSGFRVEGAEDAPPRRSSELRVWCIWQCI